MTSLKSIWIAWQTSIPSYWTKFVRFRCLLWQPIVTSTGASWMNLGNTHVTSHRSLSPTRPRKWLTINTLCWPHRNELIGLHNINDTLPFHSFAPRPTWLWRVLEACHRTPQLSCQKMAILPVSKNCLEYRNNHKYTHVYATLIQEDSWIYQILYLTWN